MPCPILLVMERDQLGMHSVWSLTSLQILVRVTFMTKHIQVTREVHPAGYSIFLMRAAVIMHGWLCLASANYLKNCHLPISNAPQLHIQRAHHQSMVWIPVATCNIPLLPPQPETMGWSKGNGTLVLTVIPLAQMCRSYHMRMHQMMHLREMWLQKRKHALHTIVQLQSLSRVWTISVDEVVKRKYHSSSCFLYKTKMCM